MQYRVTWTIDVEAESHVSAACRAFQSMKRADPTDAGSATCLSVEEWHDGDYGLAEEIDLAHFPARANEEA